MCTLEEKLAAARRAKDAQSEFAHPRRSRCRLTVGEQTPFAHSVTAQALPLVERG